MTTLTRPLERRVVAGAEDFRGGGDSLAQLRGQGESLLSAANEAIERALSADSRIFLESVRQRGGQ
jgi:hypothetical protein